MRVVTATLRGGRRCLTVEEILLFSARLRLSADSEPSDHLLAVEYALEVLGLTEIRHQVRLAGPPFPHLAPRNSVIGSSHVGMPNEYMSGTCTTPPRVSGGRRRADAP
jgi:hypothetical protein